MRLRLEVEAVLDDGFTPETVFTVSENADTLNLEQSDFED